MNAEKKLPVADNISSRRVCGIGTAMVALASFCPLLLAENLVRVDRDRFGGYMSEMSTVMARTKCSSRGYPTDTIEQIMVALDSPDGSVRMSALILLVAQAGEEAVPVLRKALGDKDVFVRKRAATLLGSLGDASGLPVLRGDYDALIAKLAPSDPNRADPNMARAVLLRIERPNERVRPPCCHPCAGRGPEMHVGWLDSRLRGNDSVPAVV